MAAFDFPTSPSVNDTYTANGVEYIWDGTAWLTNNDVNALNVSVTANNSTNETVYPLFVDAQSGDRPPETDVSLTYNPSTNTLTTTTFSGALSGNATTATTATTANAWTTGRTISLTGDVTGTSAAFDGSGNLSFATTIAANSVALGTDTTGNYVATVAGTANEIAVTGSGSETAAVTVGIADNPVITGVEGIVIPSGTTAQRPVAPATGLIRFNTSTSRFEGYNGTAWVPIDTLYS